MLSNKSSAQESLSGATHGQADYVRDNDRACFLVRARRDGPINRSLALVQKTHCEQPLHHGPRQRFVFTIVLAEIVFAIRAQWHLCCARNMRIA